MSSETLSTSCVLDCPDTCSLEVTVEDGVIAKIDAAFDSGNPVTNDFICSKVRHFAKRVYHEDRLLHPMRRVGAKGSGAFTPISWDEAIEEVASRLGAIRDEHGGEAILPYYYGGSNGFMTDEFVDSIFFARLGASRLGKTICAAPTSAVAEDMYGKMAGVAFPDYVEADAILIWGANPKASNIHLIPYLREAKSRGAFIAVVDPVRQLSKDLVDLHLPVFPGADLPLALGMIDHWSKEGKLDRDFIEQHALGLEPLLKAASSWPLEKAAAEAGVDEVKLRELADRFASASRALLRCGWGLERNQNGGQAVAAVMAIPALLGKFGQRGSGFTLSNSGAGRMDDSQIWDRASWQTRVINMTELSVVLNTPPDPPIRGLFVFNCNPVATVPDQNGIIQGLSRDDLFTVVSEQVMTDTARYADIVLPATTFLEHRELKLSYGNYVVGATEPVIEPRGEARTNIALFSALGRAMGFTDEAFRWSEDDAREKIIAAIRLNGKPVSAEPLRAGKFHGYDFDGPAPIQFENVFPATPGGKIQLTPECLGERPYHYDPVRSEFPLALISPATSKTVSSTLGEFNLPELRATLHPGDAEPRGIKSGDRVRVFNELGEVMCHARVDERVRAGVVHIPKGAWMKSSLNQRVSTALTPTHVNVVAGGACFNDARVEVERLG
ncbi:MAG: molybdopterin oxidoreductase family protein [Acidobacteria bacterium]|nr:MAG: molybdopterin oxidoreductase family protein [Acidobacteriota bacterium]